VPRRSPQTGRRPRDGHGLSVLPVSGLPVEAEAGQEASRDHDDTTAQLTLSYELKYEIDRVIRTPAPHLVARVIRLVTDNPHGVRTKFVLHNLGKTRNRWLSDAHIVMFSYDDGLLDWLIKEDLI
jgi:hypothetical protein